MKQLYSKHIIELIVIYFIKFNNYKTAFYLFHKFLRKYNLIFMKITLIYNKKIKNI